jgi:hypothetical protein
VTPELTVERHGDLTGGESTATFSPDRTYRYALTRRWGQGPLTVFVMLNPSIADAFADDPTIRRCIGFARRFGSAGLLVVNAFGLRATNPDALKTHPDPVGLHNDAVITDALTTHTADRVIAAWGVHYRMAGRRDQLTALLAAVGHPLLCLGLTQGGHPRHPLYVAGTTPPIPLPA